MVSPSSTEREAEAVGFQNPEVLILVSSSIAAIASIIRTMIRARSDERVFKIGAESAAKGDIPTAIRELAAWRRAGRRIWPTIRPGDARDAGQPELDRRQDSDRAE